jgi:hypothetical protein
MQFQPLANPTNPEAPHARLVRGDFSKLSHPILVAAESEKQLDHFIALHAFIPSEIHRFQGYQERFNTHPENKVLLLLPGWSHHSRTAEAVDYWVNVQDRHTCQLTAPPPSFRRHRGAPESAGLLMRTCLIAAVVITIILLTK